MPRSTDNSGSKRQRHIARLKIRLELFLEIDHHEGDQLLGLALARFGALARDVRPQGEDRRHRSDDQRCHRQAHQRSMAQHETGQPIGGDSPSPSVGLDHLPREARAGVSGARSGGEALCSMLGESVFPGSSRSV